MASRRIEYGRLSFMPPEGFSVLEDASILGYKPGADHDSGDPGTPATVTLIGTAAHPGVPDYSESPSDMNPNAYPASITLSINEPGGSPMACLHSMERVMKSHFTGYEVHFFKNAKIGDLPAARSQSAYKSNFKIFRLNYAWHMNSQIVTACLTVSESSVRKGWNDLLAFAASIRLC